MNYEFSELFSEPKEDAQVCEKKKADLRAKFEINQINRGHTGVKVKKLSEINPPLVMSFFFIDIFSKISAILCKFHDSF